MKVTIQPKLHISERRFMSRGPKGESGHRRLPARHARFFLPGQPVPETGIYEVVHDRSHRPSHEAVMHREDLFPLCDQCDTRVRFKLVRTAPYIFDDADFVDEE